MDNLASDAETAAGTNNMRQLYSIVGRLTNQQSSSKQPIRDLNGALLTCNEDQIRRWKKHFEATSNLASSSDYIFEEPNASSNSKISITCVSLAEIKDTTLIRTNEFVDEWFQSLTQNARQDSICNREQAYVTIIAADQYFGQNDNILISN